MVGPQYRGSPINTGWIEKVNGCIKITEIYVMRAINLGYGFEPKVLLDSFVAQGLDYGDEIFNAEISGQGAVEEIHSGDGVHGYVAD